SERYEPPAPPVNPLVNMPNQPPPPVAQAPDFGPQQQIPIGPPAPPVASPPSPLPPIPDTPPASIGRPEAAPLMEPPSALTRIMPQPQPQQPEPPLPMGPCPWTLKMTIVDGLTVMEARIGKEIQFRIVCEKLDLQTPRGAIHAQGDVKISGAGLDGHCDRLLINWHVDQIVVEGNAYLKCLREGHDVELTADRLSLRLSESSTVKGVGRRKDVPAEE